MEDQEDKKLKLEINEKRDLMIFFFVAHRTAIVDPTFDMSRMNEVFVVAVIAYDMHTAFAEGQQKNPGCLFIFNHTVKNQSMTVKEFLARVDLVDREALKEPIPAAAPEQITKKDDPDGIERFKAGLIMAAKEYANPEDEKALIEIIRRIKK